MEVENLQISEFTQGVNFLVWGARVNKHFAAASTGGLRQQQYPSHRLVGVGVGVGVAAIGNKIVGESHTKDAGREFFKNEGISQNST